MTEYFHEDHPILREALANETSADHVFNMKMSAMNGSEQFRLKAIAALLLTADDNKLARDVVLAADKVAAVAGTMFHLERMNKIIQEVEKTKLSPEKQTALLALGFMTLYESLTRAVDKTHHKAQEQLATAVLTLSEERLHEGENK